MKKHENKKGSLGWCVSRANALGVSYGHYMAEYFRKEMKRKERKKDDQ